jgi:DNA-binding XRE family transcriptional regulator
MAKVTLTWAGVTLKKDRQMGVKRAKQMRGGPPDSFGARLKELRAKTPGRNRRSLTQEGLARTLDVSLFTVNGWERLENSDTLRVGSLLALADFFRVEPRWLAQGTGPKRAAR